MRLRPSGRRPPSRRPVPAEAIWDPTGHREAPGGTSTCPVTRLPGSYDPSLSVLRGHFGHPSFRPGQRELVDAALAGRDALGVLPTGGGKSLCYQVPAILLDGITVVVSPLISLMGDQVRRAREAGIAAEALHSGLSVGRRRRIERGLGSGKLRLLLIAPERFASQAFTTLLERLQVALLVIDEAHCISLWGHDFRPAYRDLGRVRRRLSAPVMALTATATPAVRADIRACLRMSNPFEMVGSFDRGNLFWAVMPTRGDADKERQLLELISRQPGARLIYAATRRRVERVRARIARMGRRTEAYHAGLPATERDRVQEYFMEDDGPLVVATNAFGMGIDRPDVRLVVHDQLPGSLENYFQEAGRAGRDGELAHCVALFDPTDRRVHRAFLDRRHPPLRTPRAWWRAQAEGELIRRLRRRRVEKTKHRAVRRYAQTRSCRRIPLLGWFGERFPTGVCGTCDRCVGF